MRRFLTAIGAYTIAFVTAYGRVAILVLQTIAAFRKIPTYLPHIVEQYNNIERKSRPLIFLTSTSMGLILGVQIGTQIGSTTPAWVEGGLILRSILLEMGPLIMALVLSGRVGSGIAAELGSMQVTEQIDALRAMAVDPIEFLVMPRVVAGLIAVPVIIVYANLLAIVAGFVSSFFTIHMTWSGFVKGMRREFVLTDVWASLIKSVIFGQVFIIFGCYFGMNSKRGAKGVGNATTQAFVWSAIAILIFDYIISALLFFVW